MHLGVAQLVADVVEPFGRRQLTGALEHPRGYVDADDAPGAAARAASRVVSPAPHPMSRTTSPGLIPYAARRCSWWARTRRRRSPGCPARTSARC